MYVCATPMISDVVKHSVCMYEHINSMIVYHKNFATTRLDILGSCDVFFLVIINYSMKNLFVRITRVQNIENKTQ